jgi:MFS family permease
MLPAERRAVAFLALIYAVRMAGLFVVLPVLALHAATLGGVTPRLTGLAIGIYGLTQAVLQIPYGAWSDRYGRRRIIIIGLLVFAAGSVFAGAADTIYMLILGRALQGAGAVAGVVMALAADLTRESQRSKAMAAIGASIGASFLLSIVAGPALYTLVGGHGIFYFTALTAVLAVGVLQWGVPRTVATTVRVPAAETSVAAQQGRPLFGINLGIFMLHAVLTGCFVAIPGVLRDTLGLPVADHWKIYLLAMLAGLCLMLPCLLYAEKAGRIRTLLIAATLCLAICLAGLAGGYGKSLYGFTVLLCLFFTAFNALEAVFPSLVSRMAAAGRKGAALGTYATSQFLGAFCGGVTAGWVLQQWGADGVFRMTALYALLWLPLAFGIKMLPGLVCYTLRFNPHNQQAAHSLRERLQGIAGVREISIVESEGIAYVHVDKGNFDFAAFEEVIPKT